MGGYSLDQAKKVVDNLLDQRMEQLRRLQTADAHIAKLTELQAEVDLAVIREKAFGEGPVRRLFELHVQATAALSMALNAHAANPTVPTAEREAATRLYHQLVRSRRGNRATAAERAVYLVHIEAKRPQFAGDLALLPAAARDLFEAWVSAAREIDTAINARTDRPDEVLRSVKDIVRDVGQVIGRLRRAIRAELAVYDNLPDGLEAQILGYADAMSSGRRRVERPAASMDAEVDAAPVVPVPIDPGAPLLPLDAPMAVADLG